MQTAQKRAVAKTDKQTKGAQKKPPKKAAGTDNVKQPGKTCSTQPGSKEPSKEESKENDPPKKRSKRRGRKAKAGAPSETENVVSSGDSQQKAKEPKKNKKVGLSPLYSNEQQPSAKSEPLTQQPPNNTSAGQKSELSKAKRRRIRKKRILEALGILSGNNVKASKTRKRKANADVSVTGNKLLECPLQGCCDATTPLSVSQDERVNNCADKKGRKTKQGAYIAPVGEVFVKGQDNAVPVVLVSTDDVPSSKENRSVKSKEAELISSNKQSIGTKAVREGVSGKENKHREDAKAVGILSDPKGVETNKQRLVTKTGEKVGDTKSSLLNKSKGESIAVKCKSDCQSVSVHQRNSESAELVDHSPVSSNLTDLSNKSQAEKTKSVEESAGKSTKGSKQKGNKTSKSSVQRLEREGERKVNGEKLVETSANQGLFESVIRSGDSQKSASSSPKEKGDNRDICVFSTGKQKATGKSDYPSEQTAEGIKGSARRAESSKHNESKVRGGTPVDGPNFTSANKVENGGQTSRISPRSGLQNSLVNGLSDCTNIQSGAVLKTGEENKASKPTEQKTKGKRDHKGESKSTKPSEQKIESISSKTENKLESKSSYTTEQKVESKSVRACENKVETKPLQKVDQKTAKKAEQEIDTTLEPKLGSETVRQKQLKTDATAVKTAPECKSLDKPSKAQEDKTPAKSLDKTVTKSDKTPEVKAETKPVEEKLGKTNERSLKNKSGKTPPQKIIAVVNEREESEKVKIPVQTASKLLEQNVVQVEDSKAAKSSKITGPKEHLRCVNSKELLKEEVQLSNTPEQKEAKSLKNTEQKVETSHPKTVEEKKEDSLSKTLAQTVKTIVPKAPEQKVEVVPPKTSQQKESKLSKTSEEKVEPKAPKTPKQKVDVPAETPDREVEPEVPKTPEEKVEPKVPKTPEEKVEPKVPKTPEEKVEPKVPKTPEEKVEPKVPKTPEQKVEAVSPKTPEQKESKGSKTPKLKAEPKVPKTPEEKAEPKVPKTPEEKAEPKVPKTPEEKAEPKVPKTPEEKAEPKVPKTPKQKVEAVSPKTPKQKVEAVSPKTPDEKGDSKVSKASEEKVEPKVSKASEEKVELKVSKAPEEKVEPKVSKTPEEKVEPKVSKTPEEKVEPKVSKTPEEKAEPKVPKTPKQKVEAVPSETPVQKLETVSPKTPEQKLETVSPKTPEQKLETVSPKTPEQKLTAVSPKTPEQNGDSKVSTASEEKEEPKVSKTPNQKVETLPSKSPEQKVEAVSPKIPEQKEVQVPKTPALKVEAISPKTPEQKEVQILKTPEQKVDSKDSKTPEQKVKAVSPKTPERKVDSKDSKTPEQKVKAVSPKTPEQKVKAVSPKTPEQKVKAVSPKTPDQKGEPKFPESFEEKVEPEVPKAPEEKIETVTSKTLEQETEAVSSKKPEPKAFQVPKTPEPKLEAVSPKTPEQKVETVSPKIPEQKQSTVSKTPEEKVQPEPLKTPERKVQPKLPKTPEQKVQPKVSKTPEQKVEAVSAKTPEQKVETVSPKIPEQKQSTVSKTPQEKVLPELLKTPERKVQPKLPKTPEQKVQPKVSKTPEQKVEAVSPKKSEQKESKASKTPEKKVESKVPKTSEQKIESKVSKTPEQKQKAEVQSQETSLQDSKSKVWNAPEHSVAIPLKAAEVLTAVGGSGGDVSKHSKSVEAVKVSEQQLGLSASKKAKSIEGKTSKTPQKCQSELQKTTPENVKAKSSKERGSVVEELLVGNSSSDSKSDIHGLLQSTYNLTDKPVVEQNTDKKPDSAPGNDRVSSVNRGFEQSNCTVKSSSSRESVCSSVLSDISLSAHCSEKEVKNFYNTYGTFPDRNSSSLTTAGRLLNSSSADSNQSVNPNSVRDKVGKSVSPENTSLVTDTVLEKKDGKFVNDNSAIESSQLRSIFQAGGSFARTENIPFLKGPIYTSPNFENKVTSSVDSNQVFNSCRGSSVGVSVSSHVNKSADVSISNSDVPNVNVSLSESPKSVDNTVPRSDKGESRLLEIVENVLSVHEKVREQLTSERQELRVTAEREIQSQSPRDLGEKSGHKSSGEQKKPLSSSDICSNSIDAIEELQKKLKPAFHFTPSCTAPAQTSVPLVSEEKTTQKTDSVEESSTMQTAEKSREEVVKEREARKAAKLAKKNKGQSGVEVKTPAAGVHSSTQPSQSVSMPGVSEKTKPGTLQVSVELPTTKVPSFDEVDRSPTVIPSLSKEITGVAEKGQGEVGVAVSNKAETKVVNADQPTKSKAELRAERRAKQEAQRAAKASAQQQKAAASAPADTQVKRPVPTQQVVPKTVKSPTKAAEPAKEVSKAVAIPQHRVKLFSHLYLKQEASIPAKVLNDPNLHPAIIRLGVQYASKVVVGSNARCLALLHAMKQVIENYRTPPQKEFARGLEASLQPCTAFLQDCRPLSVSMTNALKHLKWQMNQLPNNISDVDARRRLQEAIDTYIREQIEVAGLAICNTVLNKISNGDVILTYGCSSLVQRILIQAHESGSKFRVVVVDGRPWREGKEMLRRLVKCGLKCSYVLISAASFIMREVTKVLLGAHALLANGYVMSRAGSSQVAMLAHSYNVPVLVCCETHKFSERVQTDSFVYNELGNPDELAVTDTCVKDKPLAKWKAIPHLTPLNLTYDVTPPDLVTAVVTELAILPCTSVPVILRIKPTEIGF
ncbi:microtubule-associated protein futsch [Anabrus simplex]|uniref:microtubule-associated protein futsch n=1 Tax=Anabrus simplex TaxID=316456 RepID=UPI0035A309AC